MNERRKEGRRKEGKGRKEEGRYSKLSATSSTFESASIAVHIAPNPSPIDRR